MKGLILAGGLGTRLRPLSHTGPKQLVPIANKPILHYIIEDLRDAGITDIGIIVGYTKKRIQHLVDSVGDGSKFGVRITYIEQEGPYGLSHAVMTARQFLGEDDFVVYLGDNMLKHGISKLVQDFKSSNADASLLLSRSDTPEKFGNAIIQDNKITDLEEKPKEPKTNLVITGIYLFRPSIYSFMYKVKPQTSEREWGLTEAIREMVLSSTHNVTYSIVEGWWDDTGTANAVLRANRLVLQQLEHDIKGRTEENVKIMPNVKIGENTIIRSGTVLEGPIIIGNNCEIGPDTYIGPSTSIGDNSIIRNAEVQNSVIMEGCQIDIDKRIVNSVIGKNAKIKKNNNTQRGHSFVLGESSEAIL